MASHVTVSAGWVTSFLLFLTLPPEISLHTVRLIYPRPSTSLAGICAYTQDGVFFFCDILGFSACPRRPPTVDNRRCCITFCTRCRGILLFLLSRLRHFSDCVQTMRLNKPPAVDAPCRWILDKWFCVVDEKCVLQTGGLSNLTPLSSKTLYISVKTTKPSPSGETFPIIL